MGGLCSKSANEADPFAQPGRLLGSENSQPSSAAPPRKLTSSTPGRTLGGANDSAGGSSAANDARSAAARAAEVGYQQTWEEQVSTRSVNFVLRTCAETLITRPQERASKASKGTGKLSSQLEAQKKQTRNELLAASSEQERRARDADEAAQARNYN